MPVAKLKALAVAVVWESVFLLLLFARVPDPPLDLLDILVFALQFPSAIAIYFFRGSIEGGALVGIVFVGQVWFFALLVLWLNKRLKFF